MRITKTQLAFGVASAALAAGISSQAQAACTTSSTTVTCSTANTATDVNTATNGVAGDDVTLNVAAGATVVQPGSAVQPLQTGTVTVTNNGTLGTDAANVGIDYLGDPTSADNSFTLTNLGRITGEVSVTSVGGSIAIDNSGVIGNDAGLQAIFAVAGAPAFTSSTSTVTDVGVTTTTNTSAETVNGGTVDVSIAATGSAGSVLAAGLDSATVTIDGAIGSEDQFASVSVDAQHDASSFTGTTVSRADSFHFESHSTDSTVGGDAAIAVGISGSVSGDLDAEGFTSAAVTVDGTVGNDGDDRSVTASAHGEEIVVDVTSDNDFTTGSSSNSTQAARSLSGGDASVEVSATGVVHGSVLVSGDNSAAVTNAGAIDHDVAAVSATGGFNSFEQTNSFTRTTSATGAVEVTQSSLSFTTQDLGGEASVENAVGGSIGGDVFASGVAGASVGNAGRIDGSIAVNSVVNNQSLANSFEQTDSYDSSSVLLSRETSATFSNAFTAAGGTASFTNAATGLVVGSVQVSGDAGVDIENQGAVTGTTLADSMRTLNSFTSENTSSTAFAADGTVTQATTFSNQTTVVTAGGDVTGVYAGTNGAHQFTPTGASDGSVSQFAAGDSSAAVTGTIIGNYHGEAAAFEFVSTGAGSTNQVNTPATADAVSTVEIATQTDTETSTGFGSSTSALAVNGGTITGNATLLGSGGASADLGNGAAIDGNVFLSAQYSSSTGSTSTATTSSFADGDFVGSTFDQHTESASETGTGNVSLTLGEATIGGSASLLGSAGDTVLELTEDAEIGGSASLSANTSQFTSSSDDLQETTATGSTRTVTTDFASTATGGNVTATVDGVIGTGLEGALPYASGGGSGDLSLSTTLGDASATVTGQVGDGIFVSSEGANTSFSSTTDYVDGAEVSYSETSGSTATGGSATLVLDSATGADPVNFGDIEVAGLAGSTLTVSADTIAAARPGADVEVGAIGTNSTSSYSRDNLAATESGSFSETAVGGASSLTNDGQIGFADANYLGTSASVEVESATDASAINNGSIFGSIDVAALGYNENSEFSSVNVGDVTRVTTNTFTYVPYGGTAALTNNGLITGDAEMSGADATLINNGVIRGDVFLGESVENAVTQSVDTFVQIGDETLLEAQPLFVQSYNLDQNGALGGTIAVGGAFGDVEDADGNPLQTSDIQATVNLNAGSVTLGGVHAEFDEATGERFTTTNVNLVDNGYLGIDLNTLDDDTVEALVEKFGAFDPAVDSSLLPEGLVAGARVQGVENLTKTGAGTFRIVGADMVPATNLNPLATYTLDVGTFAINEGEVQLATVGDGDFGIRGDLVNSASLVLGTRVTIPQTLFASNITSQGVEGIDGVSLYQMGDFTQTATGSLSVGIMPALVRVVDPTVGDVIGSDEPLGVGSVQYGQGLFTSPEQAYGAAYSQLTPSSATIDGNLTLAGTIDLVAPTGGLFLDGQSLDLFSVSGAVDHSTASVEGVTNNFVTFDLVDTTDGDRTIVSVVASRAGYETAATNSNAAAAGAALTAALPDVADALVADANGDGSFASVEEFELTQDMATVMAGLDSRLTAAGAAAALDEMATGSFYGSITSLRTTAPFADVLTARRAAAGAQGFNLWMQPSGDFTRIDGSSATGARKLHADNYGGSGGFGIATGSGEFGLGFGYGEIHSHSGDDLTSAKAKTWMAGIYGRQGFGPLTIAADLVLGWSNWDATRAMPTLSREAEASFDSKEVRGDLRVEYAFDLGAAKVSPFGQLELRHYNFDGFEEEEAGGVGLAVEGKSKSVLTPTLGVKAEGSFETGMATLRPMVAVSYSFKDNNDADRTVAFLGAPSESFRLQGVDQKGFVTLQGGLFADIGAGSGAFLSGSYSTGGGNDSAGVKAGVVVGF